MTGDALARTAASLVGAPFRLHGRHPQYGIDCIGLLQLALQKTGLPAKLPNGYPMRMRNPHDWIPDPDACGFAVAEPPFLPGDVILVCMGRGQVHLAITGMAGTWVHAHAGLRRVVASPAPPQGRIIGHWRPTSTNCKDQPWQR